MTPAVKAAQRAKIAYRIHRYEHDPAAQSYGLEAAQALELNPRQVFKTLLVALEDDAQRLAVVIVPVDRQLDLKALAAALDCKRVAMAQPRDAERATGYVVGGISPLGQRRRLPTIIDESVSSLGTVYVSAGRRGLEIELAPDDLSRLTHARLAAVAH
jgi:Cys-tRNA(Pro)/Cys-tRNA(Cys) deacylase